MALMTQACAIRRLRVSTGLSFQSCVNAVRDMPKVADGSRQKVSERNVAQAIEKALEVPMIQVNNVRPISARKAARIRERCI